MTKKVRFVTHTRILYWVQDVTSLDPHESVRSVILDPKVCRFQEGHGYYILKQVEVKFRQRIGPAKRKRPPTKQQIYSAGRLAHYERVCGPLKTGEEAKPGRPR